MGNIIKQINPNKAGRSHDVEAKFIKYANIIIPKHLSKLFNICLLEGIYPDDMKVTEMVPMYKKGDCKPAANYRLISLLSDFNNFFEKCCGAD